MAINVYVVSVHHNNGGFLAGTILLIDPMLLPCMMGTRLNTIERFCMAAYIIPLPSDLRPNVTN